jgi:hypothetical protein
MSSIETKIRSFIFAIWASIIAFLPSANSQEVKSFEILQLSHMFNQFDEVANKTSTELLEQSGVHQADFRLFSKGIVSLGRGKLLDETRVCEGTTVINLDNNLLDLDSDTFQASWFANQASPEERLTILSKAGPIVLWSWLFVTEYVEPDLTDDGEGGATPLSESDKLLREQMNRVYCVQMKRVYDAFNGISGTDDQAVKKLVSSLYQQKLVGSKTLVFNPLLTEAKATLYPYQFEILALLERNEEFRNHVISLVEAGEALEDVISDEQLLGHMLNVVETNLKRRASIAIIRAINRFSPSATHQLEELMRAAGIDPVTLDNAQKALDTLASLDKKALKDRLLQHLEAAKLEHERTINAAIHTINEAFTQKKAQIKETIKDAEEVAKDIAQKEIDGLLAGSERVCSDGINNLVDLANGPFRWGEMPTKEKPVGYRITISPSGRVLKDAQSQLYEAKIQLLLWVPDALHISDDPTCPNSSSPSVRAVDLGFTVANLKQVTDAVTGAKQYINQSAVNLVASVSVDVDAYQKGLESLGIPGAWFASVPGLSVDKYFKNISIKPNVLSGGIDPIIPIIKDGVSVFNPKEVGKQYCYAIESKYAKALAQSWASNLSFDVAGYRAYVNANANVNIVACDVLYPDVYRIKDSTNEDQVDSMQYPRPLDSSALALTIEMGVMGIIDGENFRWGGISALEIDPRGNSTVNLKSFVLDSPPAVIQRVINKRIRDLGGLVQLRDENAAQLSVRIGSAAIDGSLSRINANVLMDITTEQCRTELLNTTVSIPDLAIDVDEDKLANKIKDMLICQGEDVITNLAYSAIDCADIKSSLGSSSLFGLAIIDSPEVSIADRSGTHCSLTVDGSLFDQPVMLSNIIASISVDGVKMDFSEMQGVDTLEKSAKSYIENITRPISESGVTIKDTKVDKKGVSFSVVLNGNSSLNGTKIGPLDVGRIHITYDGKATVETEIARVLVKRLEAVYGPTFTKIAKRFAPNQVKSATTHMDIENGKLKVWVDLRLKVYGDIEIDGIVHIAPDFSAQLDVDASTLQDVVAGKLKAFIEPLLKFGKSGIAVTDVRIVQNASLGVGLRTGLSIKLEQLGTISLTDVYIGSKGLKLNGRAELRVDTFIYLTPAPVPILITEPGVYYDFSLEKVGVLGDFTILEATLADVVKITGEFSISDPDNFLETLSLEGEVILMDSLPIVTARGQIHFPALRADFEAYTSKMLEKIFSARMSGYVDAHQLAMGMDTTMSVFGVELSRALVSILLKQCPDICIEAAMGMSLPIGSADMSVKTGPFLVNGQLNARFDVAIKKYKLGSVGLGVQLFRADLGFEFLGIGLDISTPGIEDMTPEYIAKILASLLDVSIEDLLKWLEDPEIKFQPAGSPSSSDSSGQDDGNDSSQQDGDGQGKGKEKKNNTDGQSNEASEQQEADEKNGEKDEPDVKATLRNKQGDTYGRYACRKDDLSWGVATKYKNGNWYYSARYRDINPESWKLVCTNHMSNETILDGVELINDTYRPIEVNAQIRTFEGEPLCDSTGKVCTITPQYKYRETGKNRDGQQMTNTLVPFVRKISVAGSSKEEPNWRPLVVEARKSILRKMEDLFERYEDDKDKYEADGKAVKSWLRGLTLKQTGLKVDSINDDDIDFPLAWFGGDNSTHDIDFSYKNKIPVSPKEVDQYVTIWTKIDLNNNKAVLSDALLVEHCQAEIVYTHNWFGDVHTHRYKDWLRSEDDRRKAPVHCQGEHLDSFQDKTPDQRIQQALQQIQSSISVNADNGNVIVDISEASWLVSNAISAIIGKREFEKIGKTITPDANVTPQGCQVTSIRSAEILRAVQFQSFKKENGIRVGSDYEVGVFGKHRDWLQTTQDSNGTPTKYWGTMGSFLSCHSNASQWLDEHHLWLRKTLEPVDETLLPLSGPTLLFKTKQSSNPEQLNITQIVGGVGIANFTVQKRLPYNLPHYPAVDKIIYKKLLMIPGHNAASMVSLQQNHIEFLTNQQEDLEYVLRYIKPQSSHMMVHIEVRQFCTEQREDDTQCKSSRFLEQPAGHQFAIGETVINRCLDQLGISGTSNSGPDRLMRFLSETDPIVRYGVSALPVLQSLHNNPSFQCN